MVSNLLLPIQMEVPLVFVCLVLMVLLSTQLCSVSGYIGGEISAPGAQKMWPRWTQGLHFVTIPNRIYGERHLTRLVYNCVNHQNHRRHQERNSGKNLVLYEGLAPHVRIVF